MCKENINTTYFSAGGIYSGGVTTDYKKCIAKVKNYWKYHQVGYPYKSLHGDIKEFVEHFAKYESA
jgi:hypothetical protein